MEITMFYTTLLAFSLVMEFDKRKEIKIKDLLNFRNELIRKYLEKNDEEDKINKYICSKKEEILDLLNEYSAFFSYNSGYIILNDDITLDDVFYAMDEQEEDNPILYYLAFDKKLFEVLNIRKIYVDTVGPAESYKNLLKASLDDSSIVVTVEAKADAKYECVSAASIVAKVTRDHHIEIIEKEDKDCGSGYPSDPKTKEWLKNNYDNVFGFGREVRFSWKTVDAIFKENNNKCEWEDYDSEEENEKYKKNKKDKKENDENKNLKIDNMIEIKEMKYH